MRFQKIIRERDFIHSSLKPASAKNYLPGPLSWEMAGWEAAPRLGFRPAAENVTPGAPFTGKELDEETQLYYFGARYYDPRTSVWQSADPILGKYLPDAPKKPEDIVKLQPTTMQQPLARFNLPGMGGVFSSTNLAMYTYVGGNPLSYVDPTGRVWEFSQTSGQWSHVDDQTGVRTNVGTGYSGTGEGRNNPAMQEVPNVGPTPQGRYDIGPGHASPNTGPNTMNLTPQEGNNTSRTDLRIHGNNAENDASHGCAIAPPDVRTQINDSTDRVLEVTQ